MRINIFKPATLAGDSSGLTSVPRRRSVLIGRLQKAGVAGVAAVAAASAASPQHSAGLTSVTSTGLFNRGSEVALR